MKQYFLNVLLWLDEGVAGLLGYDPGYTVSVVAGLAARKGKRWGCILCGLLNKVDPNHCESAIANLDKHGPRNP